MYEEEEELPCFVPSSSTGRSAQSSPASAHGVNSNDSDVAGTSAPADVATTETNIARRYNGTSTCTSTSKPHMVQMYRQDAVGNARHNTNEVDVYDDNCQPPIPYVSAKQRRLDMHTRCVPCATSNNTDRASDNSKRSDKNYKDVVPGMIGSSANTAQRKRGETEGGKGTLDSYNDGQLPDDTDVAHDKAEFAAWKLRQARRPIAFD